MACFSLPCLSDTSVDLHPALRIISQTPRLQTQGRSREGRWEHRQHWERERERLQFIIKIAAASFWMLTMCWAYALILVSISDVGAILIYAFYRWASADLRNWSISPTFTSGAGVSSWLSVRSMVTANSHHQTWWIPILSILSPKTMILMILVMWLRLFKK